MKILLRSFVLLLALGHMTSYADNYKTLDKPVTSERIPSKVVVQQFLSHQCQHCMNLETTLVPWLKSQKADDVVFERIPVVWRPEQAEQAAVYGLAKVMQFNGEITEQQLDNLNTGLFALHFIQEQPFNLVNTYPFFQLAGIATPEAYQQRLYSAPVMHQRTRATQLTRSYRVSSVPLFVVDGTYVVSMETLEGDRSAENLIKALEQTIDMARKAP